MKINQSEDKRKARRKNSAECFTPPFLTNNILDKLTQYTPKDFWKDETKTFLDPSCGNGNILVETYKRKLRYNHNPLQALSTLFGTDIFQDNIHECRLRLLKVFYYHTKSLNIKEVREAAIKIVFTNIICTPLSRYPMGSLDYDFSFPDKLPKSTLKIMEDWEKNIIEWLENVDEDKGIIGELNTKDTKEKLNQINTTTTTTPEENAEDESILDWMK